MVIKMITRLFAVVLFILGASSGALVTTTTTSSPSTSSSDWAEHPHTDGRNGLPGAVGMVCEKSMDVIHRFAGDMLAKAIKASNMPDVPVNVGNHGTLTVKSPRIEEAVLQEFNYDMIPPNKISTRFYDGRLAANGVWQYKTNQGEMYGGTYKVQIRNFRLNATNQLFRSNDARPAIKMERCRADISELRVEARGGDPTTREGMFLTRALAIARNPDNQTMVIENCDSELCKMIITRFEQEICRIFEGFMEEVINKEMQSVPTKMCIHGDQYRVDYSVLYGEPTVNESSKCIHVGKEGKYLWRNSYGAPFNPAPMEWTNRDSMYSFRLSDFTFNTLFHQAHQSGHRFSVSDKKMDESSSNNDEDDNEDELLSMNCDESPSHPAQHARKERPTKSSTTSTTRSTTTKKSTPTSKSTTKRSTPTTRSTTTKSTPTSKSTTTKSTTSKSTPKSTSTSTSSTTSTTTTTPTSTSTSTSTTSTSTTSKPTPAIAPAHVRKPRSTKSTTTRSTTTKSSTSSSTSKSTPSTTTKSTTTRTTSKPKSTTTRSHKPRAASMGGVNEVKCLGSLFSNSSNFGPYKGNETGDIVFKTSKPFVVYIESDERGFFDGSNGVLEFYGAKGQNGQRPFLARADVRTMRGQFTPKLNKSNITGSIKLDTLELAPSSQSSWSSSGNNNVQMTPEWFERAATFSKPMIERSINNFLRRYAQFGVPMPSKYECSSPAMNIMPRTIQMDCDVRQVQCESEPACRCFRNSCVCSEPCSSNPKRGKNAMKRNKGLRRGA